MKKLAVALAIIAGGCLVLGVPTRQFTTWDFLVNRSPDILVVKCTTTPDHQLRDLLLDSEVQIISVLKGATNAGSTILTSQYWPRQGEEYLVFALWRRDGHYYAYEPYRVVPLGMDVPESIYSSGKTLNEKVQTILSYRLDRLNRELEQQKEEKKRLEDGLKELQTAR